MTSGPLHMDLLMSGDVFVTDASAALAVYRQNLDIPQPRPNWQQLFDGYGFEAWWCRLGPDLASGPTRLEIISPHGVPDPNLHHSYMQELFDSQGDRPVKAHSTPISVPDVDAMVEELQRRGVRFRLDPKIPELPFFRVWMGLSNDEPTTYRGSDDAGLRLEFLPTSSLSLPDGCDATTPPQLGSPDGAYVNVVARVFVVASLDGAMAILERVFDWAPRSTGRDERGRWARYGFGFSRSGLIEIVEPVPETPEHAIVRGWGNGPFGVRLSVNGLPARLDDLRSRGTTLRTVERNGVTVAVVDPSFTALSHIELIDHADTVGAWC